MTFTTTTYQTKKGSELRQAYKPWPIKTMEKTINNTYDPLAELRQTYNAILIEAGICPAIYFMRKSNLI
jgi:hypothetical protein